MPPSAGTRTLKRFLFPLLATLVVGSAMWAWTRWGAGDAPWEGMPLGNAGLWDEYCEHNAMEAVVRQPVNSWSNLIYLFLGLLIAQMTWQDQGQASFSGAPMRRFPLWGYSAALFFAFLCFGSFFYHASLTRIGQRLDMTATYGLVLLLITGGIYRLGWGNWWQGSKMSQRLAILLLLAADAAMLIFKWSIDGKIALPIMIGLTVVLLLSIYLKDRPAYHAGWLVAGLVSIVLSGVFRSLDVAKIGCDPHSWWQGHAAWHFFTGWAGFCVVMFLRTEKR